MKALVIIVTMVLVSHIAAALTLVKDGAPVARIYVSPIPKPDPKARGPEPEAAIAAAVRGT